MLLEQPLPTAQMAALEEENRRLRALLNRVMPALNRAQQSRNATPTTEQNNRAQESTPPPETPSTNATRAHQPSDAALHEWQAMLNVRLTTLEARVDLLSTHLRGQSVASANERLLDEPTPAPTPEAGPPTPDVEPQETRLPHRSPDALAAFDRLIDCFRDLIDEPAGPYGTDTTTS